MKDSEDSVPEPTQTADGEKKKAKRQGEKKRRAGRGKGSLTQRAVRSALWLFGGSTVQTVVRLGSNLILVRLLAPEAFGLAAIVFSVNAGLGMLTDIGLTAAVVRSGRGEDPRFVRTAWTFQLTRFAALSLVLVGLGFLLMAVQGRYDLGETVYAAPEMPYVIMASALMMLASGASSMNVALAMRDVKQHIIQRIEIIAQLVTVPLMIGWAMISPTVWAIIGASVVSSILRCALTHVMLPGPRMGLSFDREHREEIWGFGKWLLGASFMGFIGKHGDKLILGGLLGAELFGIYSVARIWIDVARKKIRSVARPIGMAALAETARERPERLPKVFWKYRLIQNAVCAAGFAALLLGGPWFIDLVYPGRFAGVGALIPVLAPIVLLQMYNPVGNLVLMQGSSRDYAMVAVRRGIALMVSLPVAFYLAGEQWVFFAIAVNGAWGAPTLLRLASKIVPLRLLLEYAALAAVIAGCAAVTVYYG